MKQHSRPRKLYKGKIGSSSNNNKNKYRILNYTRISLCLQYRGPKDDHLSYQGQNRDRLLKDY